MIRSLKNHILKLGKNLQQEILCLGRNRTNKRLYALYTHTHTHTHVSLCIKSIFHIYIYIYIYIYRERERERERESVLETEEPRKGKRKGNGEENGKFYFRELTCNCEAWQVQDLQGRLLDWRDDRDVENMLWKEN